jgi:Domain of unknown function (DUF4126)
MFVFFANSLEFLGKCIPVVDEIVDSIEIFVVPILSILGSMGTLGLLDLAQESTGGRRLNVGDSMLIFLKVVLVVVGVVLALAIHLFKMLIRMIGLTCCAGCCQPCITIVEVTCVVAGVLVSIFIQEIAIAICVILFVAAGYAIKRKFVDKNMPEPTSGENGSAPAPAPAPAPTTNGNTTVVQSANNNDVEMGSNEPPTAPKNPSNIISSPVSQAPPSINPEFVKVECDQSQDDDVVEVEAVPVR